MAYGVILGQQPDFSKYIEKSEKGQPNGVCPLGPDGKIPIEYGGGVPTTLTVNSVPKGATITVTDGETTFTDVAETGVSTFNIPKAGNWNVKAEKDGVTDETSIEAGKYETNLSVAPIYGVEWDGTANTKWARTDNAVGFVNPTPALNNGTGSSPFDNIMPWAGMVRSTKQNAGEVVAIPKFYYKWTAVGNGLKLQISMYKIDDSYFVSPAHMDRGDGKGERDVVYVGRYHCSTNNWKSATKVNPKNNITRANARQNIHKLGANIWQWDWHMHMTIWMLYLVEFADWNCQTAIGYGCGNGSNVEHMGKSDAMKYHTGTPYSSRTTYGAGVQYRYIEGLWDNVYDWVDGCYYNSSGLNIINDPNKFSDTTNGFVVGVPTSGYPSKFVVKEVNGFQVIYPIASNGSYSTYTCDDWNFGASYPCLYLGGYYSHILHFGIGYVNYNSVSYSSASIGPRLMMLP